MSNSSIVTTATSLSRIENDLKYLVHHNTIYEDYTICNTLDMSEYKYSFDNIQMASIQIFDTAKNKYKQLKLIMNDEKIIVYPHIGTA